MKTYCIYLFLFITFIYSPLYGQLELSPQNKLTLNSSLVTGSDFSIGVDSEQGGLMINSTSTDHIGITGYSLNGGLSAFNGFDHDKGRYNIGVGGIIRLGITSDVTKVFNLLEVDDLNVDDKLTVGDEADPLFVVDSDTDKILFNTETSIDSADFTLNSTNETGYGGMYVNSEDTSQGKPFYGYANGGTVKAHHYFDDYYDTWNLKVGYYNKLSVGYNEVKVYEDFVVTQPGSGSPVFHIENDTENSMYFNTTTKIGLEDFTLNSANLTEWGGMYINSEDVVNGKPFYGYSIGENGAVFHYYDAADQYWKLNNNSNVILQANNQELVINGSIRVSNKIGSQPDGTIYYDGSNFYGITHNGISRRLDNTTSLTGTGTSSSFIATKDVNLKNENKALQEKINILENRLSEVEKMLAKLGLHN